MKNTHFVFLFATLLFAGSGCGDSAPATTAPSEKASASQQAQNPTPTAQIAQRMPRYTHTKYGFSIEPPLNWKVDESKPGLALMISSDHADEANRPPGKRQARKRVFQTAAQPGARDSLVTVLYSLLPRFLEQVQRAPQIPRGNRPIRPPILSNPRQQRR